MTFCERVPQKCYGNRSSLNSNMKILQLMHNIAIITMESHKKREDTNIKI